MFCQPETKFIDKNTNRISSEKQLVITSKHETVLCVCLFVVCFCFAIFFHSFFFFSRNLCMYFHARDERKITNQIAKHEKGNEKETKKKQIKKRKTNSKQKKTNQKLNDKFAQCQCVRSSS